jgi:Vacuolar (H+)-ATPase G subunit
MSVLIPFFIPVRLRDFVIIDRTQKLKDARSEAARDLEAYKARKEADLKEFEAKVCHYLDPKTEFSSTHITARGCHQGQPSQYRQGDRRETCHT